MSYLHVFDRPSCSGAVLMTIVCGSVAVKDATCLQEKGNENLWSDEQLHEAVKKRPIA